MIHAGVEINVPFTKCDVASFHSFHHKMGDSHYGVWGMVDYLFWGMWGRFVGELAIWEYMVEGTTI